MTPALATNEFGFGIDIPENRSLGIALVGAGAIVNVAHLPAYTAAGFNVVGVTDLDTDRTAATARRFGIPRVYADLEELLADPSVAIVDVAVPPAAQRGIATQVASAGKHLLCQKPLADDLGIARHLVEHAETSGVLLAMNLQMRWTPLAQCGKHLLERGSLGAPTHAAIQAHILSDWNDWPWIAAGTRGDLLFHTIHYLDCLRYWFGLPEWIFATGAPNPDGQTRVESRTLTVGGYPSGLQILVDTNHGTWADDRFATLRLEGSEGVMKGTIGLEYDPPLGRPDTIAIKSRRDYPTWTDPRPTGRWLPDAFAGPMASLMTAIQTGGEPATSGRDHLDTLRMVFAAYRSIEELAAVRPSELD